MRILVPIALLLAGILAQAAPGLTVNATLKVTSPVPTLKNLGTYTASLIAYQWEVDKVVDGTLADKQIIVYHWSYLARTPQPAAGWQVGQTQTLALRPYDEVAGLDNQHRSEDALLANPGLPVFYDTAQGTGLPAALSATASVEFEQAMKALDGHEATLKLFGVGDCRVADGFATKVFYAGTGQDVALNFGKAGSSLAEHEMRMRLAAALCPNLEWGFWGGGPSRLNGTPEPLIEGKPWPAIPGRVAAVTDGPIDLYFAPGIDRSSRRGEPGWAMSVERWGLIENCIREYNRRGLKFMTGLILTANAGSLARVDGMPGDVMPIIYERLRSLSGVYPNYCFIERMDIGQSWGLKIKKITPTNILEEWRVKYEEKKQSPSLMVWKDGPADPTPDPAAVAKAVEAAKAGGDNLVLGGAWIATAMAGKGVIAAVPNGGIPEAELALRTAVAAGKAPKRVIWCLDPLALTAPKTEKAIGALPGPAWPASASGRGTSLTPATVSPIRLGYGTTVARGQGVWEFGLEAYLLFETALRECERRGIQVQLVLGPNDAGIPDAAYRGIADRLRALTLQYAPVASFVEPTDLAGKSGADAAAVIADYLANPAKGVMVTAVKLEP